MQDIVALNEQLTNYLWDEHLNLQLTSYKHPIDQKIFQAYACLLRGFGENVGAIICMALFGVHGHGGGRSAEFKRKCH